jgi:proteasome-associated ATPase
MTKYLNPTVPIHPEDVERAGDMRAAVARMIQQTVDRMYAASEENRFLEVTYASGDKEILYFKDFASGAMIENVVRRAKKEAIKREIAEGTRGVRTDDLLMAIKQEFREQEDLPNTTNPDDWARISGKKGERIIYVRTLIEGDGDSRAIEAVTTGQYL